MPTISSFSPSVRSQTKICAANPPTTPTDAASNSNRYSCQGKVVLFGSSVSNVPIKSLGGDFGRILFYKGEFGLRQMNEMRLTIVGSDQLMGKKVFIGVSSVK